MSQNAGTFGLARVLDRNGDVFGQIAVKQRRVATAIDMKIPEQNHHILSCTM